MYVHSNMSRVECVEEGRFVHPGSCSEYIDCVPGGGGGSVDSLEARVGSCKGGSFDPELKKCVSANLVSNLVYRVYCT